MSKFLKELNNSQKEAILQKNGPLLIIAGAGSGKTKVLTNRIAYLIENGVSPYEILAITFTNKAAIEMKERIGLLTSSFTKKALWVSTFHSMCNKILRKEIKVLGYKINFNIYDSSDQEALIKKVIKDLKINDKQFSAKIILNQISRHKNNFKNYEFVQKNSINYFEEVIGNAYESYQNNLKKSNNLDFDDLLYLTVDMFNRYPNIKNIYQERFKYISIDEYQDTNYVQFLLIRLLSSKYNNICAVGDPDQSIYAWRGADVSNILNFEKNYKNTKIILLEQNYRSSKYILEAANEIIKNNKERTIKRLWTNNKRGDLINCFEANDEIEEAIFLIKEIKKLCKSEDREYKDFAIFYRTNAQSRVIEKALTRYGIPYVLYGGISFFKRKEIKDIIAYMQFLNNSEDYVSLERIINTPKRGIGKATIKKILDYSKEKNISIENSLIYSEKYLNKSTNNKVTVFKKIINNLKPYVNRTLISDLLEKIINETKYIEKLKEEEAEDSKERILNIKELLSEAREFDLYSEEKTLESFLSNIALYNNTDDLNFDNKITLITLHMAKGLEFNVVFIIGLEEGILPHYRVEENFLEIEEERRLFYVGLTRAKEKAYLTRAWQRNQFGRTVGNKESRFLKEIPKNLCVSLYKKKIKLRNNCSKDFFIKNTDKLKLDFSIADSIYHSKFGKGMIVKIEDDSNNSILSIAFPNIGIKKIIAKYAPIKKIN